MSNCIKTSPQGDTKTLTKIFPLCKKADILLTPWIVFFELFKEKILKIPGDVCSAVMTQVQYTEHASQQCEKRPRTA